jgi:hypothetical protein
MSTNTIDSTERLLLSLQKQISQLSSQLADAQREIQAMKNLLNNQAPQPELPMQIPNTTTPTLPPWKDFEKPTAATSPTTTTDPLPAWHDPAKLSTIKTPLPKLIHNRRARKVESAARFFQPPSPNQGFTFTYFHLKTRIPIGKLRTKLKTLGINNGRILDIHYPSTNTVAFLVHIDFVLELKQHLANYKVFADNDFNPYEGEYLKDPRYNNLSKEDRDTEAIRIHQTRCFTTILKLKQPVQHAVANFFLQDGDISEDLWDEYVTTCLVKRPTSSLPTSHTSMQTD